MKKTIVGIIVGFVIASGIALASIPDENGVIHGCYRTSNPAKGAVIVIDSTIETCPSGTVPLNWNQAGPQGATGTAGDPVSFYNDGHEFLNVETNGPDNFFVSCDEGDIAIGGTAVDTPIAPMTIHKIPVDYYDDITGNHIDGDERSWKFVVETNTTISFVLWVTCADYPPYR